MRAKVLTVMRWYAQDEVNQEDSEQNEVDGMKKEASGFRVQARVNAAFFQNFQKFPFKFLVCVV